MRTSNFRLLEQRHADGLFRLVDANRKYLREWLPWVDGNTSATHTAEFIRLSLERFAKNDAFNVGTWFQGRLTGSSVTMISSGPT